MTLKQRFSILSITAVLTSAILLDAGADKQFHAGAAASYPHQQSEQVTVGAKPFQNEDLVSSAFGKKIDFPRYGVLPVLLVIENRRAQAIDLRHVEVNLVASDGRHAKAVPSGDLPFLANAGKHPSTTGVKMPIPLPKKKNPLNAPEIAQREFSAQVLAPGDTASGFIYFEAKSESGDKLYLNGLRDVGSGQDLLYLEFPLAP